jgi:GNAT superfamily N-acetyltransferase
VISVKGWHSITKRAFSFYKCPHCSHAQESLCYGKDELASCWTCKQRVPINDFGTAKVRRWAAICANCNESISLTPRNLSGPFYICWKCENVVAVHHGNHRVVSPEQVLRLDWNPEMIARSQTVGNWRWSVCRTKKEHLVARLLFLLASEEESGFIYGLESEHHTMLAFNDEQYLGYLFWSDNRSASAGEKEPVLRQIFVRAEFRRRGIGATMVQTWAEQLALPVAPRFGVESPNGHTRRILVRLGYAHTDGESDLLPFFLPLKTEKHPPFYPLRPA